MYNESRSKGGKKVIFALIILAVIGLIATAIIGVIKKANQIDSVLEGDESSKDVTDGIYKWPAKQQNSSRKTKSHLLGDFFV
ncbi:MAG: hypothetical protein LBT19_01270 [Candidatus Nomurabacteria bacterium]|jgi:hypothetical protein|nr:hypothetical protein [Candidatus Nomurabacteria bacterium]